MLEPQIIAQVSTPFGQYEVVDTIYNGRPARVLYSGHRSAVQSGEPQDNRGDMLFDYNQRFMELYHGLLPKSVLVIGGGSFTLPKALLAHDNQLQLDVVEIDASLYMLAQQHFGFVSGPYTEVYIMDGEAFLLSQTGQYGLIMIDVFMDTKVPQNFQTANIAQMLKQHLSPNGAVVMNIIASERGIQRAPLRNQIACFETVFPYCEVFPAAAGFSGDARQNYIVTAQLQQRSLQPYLPHKKLELNDDFWA